MANLLKSRKFWTLMLDIIISTATYFVTKYAAPDVGNDILFLIGAYQPAVLLVINGITQEDTAAYAAGAHPTQLEK